MNRLQPIDFFSAEGSSLPEGVPPLKLFRTMAYAPEAMQGFMLYGAALLYQTRLDPALRELVILAVAHSCGSAYEVHEHERIAAEVGCESAKIEALREPESDLSLLPLNERERALVCFARESVDAGSPSDTTYQQAAELLDAQELVELTLCIGFYRAAAMFIATFALTPESDDFAEGVKGVQ